MRTILIVDDQASVLAALGHVFTSNGYATLLAPSGAEAIALSERERVDVALVDLHMPGLDGLAVTRALAERSRGQGHALPIWMMTAAHTREAAAKCVEAGARVLLRKPFDTAELLQEIAACLEPAALPPPIARAALDGTRAVA